MYENDLIVESKSENGISTTIQDVYVENVGTEFNDESNIEISPRIDEYRESELDSIDAQQIRDLAASLRADLSAVDSALAKVDAGTYASCDICDKPIDVRELQKNPVLALCSAHDAIENE